MDVINILKSIMDYKVKPLRAAVDAGKQAALKEQPVIHEQIESLQHFIDNCRYDPSDKKEAEQEMAEKEMQASIIRDKINRGNTAAAQMVYAKQFYKSYQDTCRKINNIPKIRDMESERAELENRLATLERNIEACEINMTPSLYGADIANQSRTDYKFFCEQYKAVYNQLQKIISDIKQLQHS